MSKNKAKLVSRLRHFLTYQAWLKLGALILAVIAWLYVRGEINKFN